MKEIQVGLRSEMRSAFGSDAQIYREASGDADSVTSSLLKREGIPGIKYLDQGSRQGGKGTQNFVVFDEQIPQILAINDEPIARALAGR